MKRTWMLRAAGIICVIAGAYIVVRISPTLDTTDLVPPGPTDAPLLYLFYVLFFGIPSIALGIVAVVGGIHALRRDIWGLALAGSMALVGFAGYRFLPILPITHVGFGVAGILCVIFVILGKRQFRTKQIPTDVSPKSRLATALLAFFLGVFGAHRFYVGRIITGIAMLLLCIAGWAAVCVVLLRRDMILVSYMFFAAVGIVTAVGMWALVDFIVVVAGDMTDKEGRLIKKQ